MSYAAATALQAAIHAALHADPAVVAALDGAIHDAPPPGALPSIFALVGPDDMRLSRDSSGRIARHDVTVTVQSAAAGFAGAKTAAAAIAACLDGRDLTLEVGRLVALDLLRVRAARHTASGGRRITLRFRARIDHS